MSSTVAPSRTSIESAIAFSGLVCAHANCAAVFSDLEDAASHANGHHAGVLVVNTCTVREEVNRATGLAELIQVPDEYGQNSEWTISDIIIGHAKTYRIMKQNKMKRIS